jgi:hypothetical protein
MTSWDDMDYVPTVTLDLHTADRLLAGAVAPKDAPPGYADLAGLLEATWTEPMPDELGRETETVAMMAAEVRTPSGRDRPSPTKRPARSSVSRARITAALVAAGLACGTALAWAGALPGPAQDVASSVLDRVGISVPDHKGGLRQPPNGSRAGAATSSSPGKGGEISRPAKTTNGPGGATRDERSRVGQHEPDTGATGTAAEAEKGNEISELAKTNKGTGGSHGATVSAAASNGKSRAGQRGSVPSGAGGKGKTDPPGGGKGKTDPPGGGKGKTDPPGGGKGKTDPPGGGKEKADPPGGGKGKAKSAPGTNTHG